nr:endoribonuclease Dicer homolog 1 [Tanacetum cinerariifolium]
MNPYVCDEFDPTNVLTLSKTRVTKTKCAEANNRGCKVCVDTYVHVLSTDLSSYSRGHAMERQNGLLIAADMFGVDDLSDKDLPIWLGRIRLEDMKMATKKKDMGNRLGLMVFCRVVGCKREGRSYWERDRLGTNDIFSVKVLGKVVVLRLLLRKILVVRHTSNSKGHHAAKKHPYSLVMSEFYYTTTKEKMPSVFGMTASPINLKGSRHSSCLPVYICAISFLLSHITCAPFTVGVSSQVNCAIKIHNLETKLDSVVCTIKDRKELEKHVMTPKKL